MCRSVSHVSKSVTVKRLFHANCLFYNLLYVSPIKLTICLLVDNLSSSPSPSPPLPLSLPLPSPSPSSPLSSPSPSPLPSPPPPPQLTILSSGTSRPLELRGPYDVANLYPLMNECGMCCVLFCGQQRLLLLHVVSLCINCRAEA